MSNLPPTLTASQRRENLCKAAEIRKQRAILRSDLKNGILTVAQVFELSDKGCQAAANMRVRQMISSMPGYAFAKTRDAMKALNIAECKRVKGLGNRQREALCELFGGDSLER